MSKNDPTLNPLRNLDLLSFVSHELKTPLTTLTLSLEELKHWQGQCPLQKEGQCPAEKHHSSNEASSTKEQSPVPGDLPAPHQKEINFLLQKMEEEVSWMSRFISDILDFRKGFGVLNPRWLSWQEVTEEVTNKLHPLSQHLKINIQVPPPPLLKENAFEVYADPLYLKQALLNVLLNALQHSPPKSTIHLTWGRAKPLTEKPLSASETSFEGTGAMPLTEKPLSASETSFEGTGAKPLTEKPLSASETSFEGTGAMPLAEKHLSSVKTPDKESSRGEAAPPLGGAKPLETPSPPRKRGSSNAIFFKKRGVDSRFRGNDIICGNESIHKICSHPVNSNSASGKGGTSHTSSPPQGSRDRTPEGFFVVEIEDQGCGLKPGEENRIFDPFHKGTSPGSSSCFKSHGLGLTLVKEIVKAHKGLVQVKNSKKGGGLVFQIKLPHFRLRQKQSQQKVA